MWLQQCGSSYLKFSWDTSLGQRKVFPKPKLDEAGEETGEMDYELQAEGEIRVDVCSFFEIFPTLTLSLGMSCNSYFKLRSDRLVTSRLSILSVGIWLKKRIAG